MSDLPAHASDPISSVFSLTQIRHLMRVEFARAQRYGYPLSVMVVACDRLDHLRDIYGYEFKEAVVEDVVALLQRRTRTCDYLGRLLDDRLMAVLPHTDREGAETGARRLVEAARELAFEADGNDLRVTLSAGVSTYADENTMFFDSLVQAAERALATAAGAGGDRVGFQDPGPATGG